MKDLKWWAYEHMEGTVHVKRYFDRRDMQEAMESDFVLCVTGPFPATDRDDAIEIAKKRFE